MARVLFRQLTWRAATLIVIEHALIVLAVVLAATLRLGTDDTPFLMLDRSLVYRAVMIAAILQVCLHYCDLYDFRTLHDRRELGIGLLRALGAASLILAFLYYWFPTLIIGRGVFLLAAVFIVTLVAGWRLAFDWLSLRVGPSERLLLVGTNAAAVDLARELYMRRQELGVELVGFVDPDPAKVGDTVINPGVVGTVAEIPQIVRDHKVDRVVVSLADARGKLSMDRLLEMKLNEGVMFDHLASVYEEYTGKIAIENLRPSWFVFSSGFRKSRMFLAAKRAVDVGLAATALVVLSPLLLLVGIAVRLTSPGPALYHQVRVGQNNTPFLVHKFRSMRVNAEAESGAVWAQKQDPRVTPIGSFLRRSRLDEFPQLWNVLVGDMSLVGPRPERPEFVEDLTRQIPFYGQRHVVKPGMTGWAQVRYSYGASVIDAMEKLQYDLFYIKNMSMSLDVFVLIETIKTVVLRKGT